MYSGCYHLPPLLPPVFWKIHAGDIQISVPAGINLGYYLTLPTLTPDTAILKLLDIARKVFSSVVTAFLLLIFSFFWKALSPSIDII